MVFDLLFIKNDDNVVVVGLNDCLVLLCMSPASEPMPAIEPKGRVSIVRTGLRPG